MSIQLTKDLINFIKENNEFTNTYFDKLAHTSLNNSMSHDFFTLINFYKMIYSGKLNELLEMTNTNGIYNNILLLNYPLVHGYPHNILNQNIIVYFDNKIIDIHGNTILMHLLKYKKHKYIIKKLLIDRYDDCDLMHINKNNESALLIALEKKRYEFALLILKKDVNIKSLMNNKSMLFILIYRYYHYYYLRYIRRLRRNMFAFDIMDPEYINLKKIIIILFKNDIDYSLLNCLNSNKIFDLVIKFDKFPDDIIYKFIQYLHKKDYMQIDALEKILHYLIENNTMVNIDLCKTLINQYKHEKLKWHNVFIHAKNSNITSITILMNNLHLYNESKQNTKCSDIINEVIKKNTNKINDKEIMTKKLKKYDLGKIINLKRKLCILYGTSIFVLCTFLFIGRKN